MTEKLNRIAIGSNASIFQKIDPSTNIAVFLPTNEEEIKEAIKFAREKDLPITSKGGGSGMSGACTGGPRKKVVISSMRLKRIHEINFDEGYAIADSGVTPNELNEQIQSLKDDWKLFISPSSRDIAALGGILSTDGGGNDVWLSGTMVDNVLAVELFEYNGTKIIVERIKENGAIKEKITCEDKALEKKLCEKNFAIIDIAGSHGILGFISKIKVKIKPLPKRQELNFALVHADNLTAQGKLIYQLIEHNIPISYGEAIVEVHHPEVSEKANPPMSILEYPAKFHEKLQDICKDISGLTFTFVDKAKFEAMKDIRIKMPKRNPPDGVQIGLFEGYGISGENLLRFEEIINEINKTLKKNTFNPFIKFGHAPSVWHVGREKIKGIILHSREIRPENLDRKTVFKAIVDIVNTCERLGVTPKPEHKWPYTESPKRQRLNELCEILGRKFNPFILDCSLEELFELVI